MVSISLQRQGRPIVYTLVPMLLVAGATIAAMLGEVAGYWRNFGDQWLLAVSGSIILVADVWVLGEGLRLLASPAAPSAPAPTTEPAAGA